MRAHIGLAFIMAAAMATLLIVPVATAQPGTWSYVCHRTGDGFRLILVNDNSLPAHGGHGDPWFIPNPTGQEPAGAEAACEAGDPFGTPF